MIENGNTHKGITESLDVLRASKTVAVLVYKAQKGGANPQQIAQRLASELIANPQAIEDLKAAAENVGEVPAEMKDLSLLEAFRFIAEAGKLAAEAAAEIQTA